MENHTFKPNPPCKDCKDRNSECHSTCKIYLDFREELDTFNSLQKEVKRLNQEAYLFRKQQVEKTMRKAMRKSR